MRAAGRVSKRWAAHSSVAMDLRPIRVLTETGKWLACWAACIISLASVGLPMSPEQQPRRTTLGTGQPMLMSIPSNSISLAISRMTECNFREYYPDLGDDFDVFLFQKLAFFVGYTKPMNDALAGFLMYEPVGRNKFGHDNMKGGWIGIR